jgi:hypothetical protein
MKKKTKKTQQIIEPQTIKTVAETQLEEKEKMMEELRKKFCAFRYKEPLTGTTEWRWEH